MHLSWVERLALPLEENPETGWQPHSIFRGRTPCMQRLTCHVSVLSPGHCPHDPHEHVQEELLIPLDGEAGLVIVDGEPRLHPTALGAFVYYPAWQGHTIRNDSPRPITYLMFKWRNDGAPPRPEGIPCGIFDYGALTPDPERLESRGWATRRIFQGPTGWLRKLHAHISFVTPGGGYEPHADPYDVAILVLSGTVETLERRIEPHDVVFYAAGEPHGLRNVGDGPASYLVFEFHGEP